LANVVPSPNDQKLSNDLELLVREIHHFEQTLSIFHFMSASRSQKDRVNFESCQINRHHVMERIRIVIQILSEAKNLGWSASV
jgi:hypothetical protein